MSDAELAYIIAPLITGGCAVLGQYVISKRQVANKRIEDAARDQRLEDRLAVVEKKIDEHNHYAAHFAEIDKNIARIDERLKEKDK